MSQCWQLDCPYWEENEDNNCKSSIHEEGCGQEPLWWIKDDHQNKKIGEC